MIRKTSGEDIYHVLDHSHANLALSAPPGRAVITCHDIIPLLASMGLIPIRVPRLTRYTFPLRIRCMKCCGMIIAISQSTKKNLVEIAGINPDKIGVSYCGVNPAFAPMPAEPNFNPADERLRILSKYGIPDSASVLFHVASPTRYKNTPAILRALKALREDAALGQQVWFLRAGADFFDDEKQLIQELRIGDRIRYAGFVPEDKDLAAHYRSADVFVFPSLWEGFGWPPLEAMACGTPVVCSNVSSLPEVVGEAGVLLPPQDHAALVEALRGLLTHKSARLALSEKSLARARRFTWEKCAVDTLEIYEQTLKRAANRCVQ